MEKEFPNDQAFKDAYPADDCDPDFVKWMKGGDADIGWAGDPTFECTPDVNPFNTAPWNQPAPGSKKTAPLTEPERGPSGGYLVPFNNKPGTNDANWNDGVYIALCIGEMSSEEKEWRELMGQKPSSWIKLAGQECKNQDPSLGECY